MEDLLACAPAAAVPTLLIAGMFRALDAFRIFDLVYVLTGGGPPTRPRPCRRCSYKILFSTLQFGYGSALSTAMFLTETLIALGFGIFIVRAAQEAMMVRRAIRWRPVHDIYLGAA